MFCPECGENAGEAKFCPECGADLAAVRTARDERAGGPPARSGARTTGAYGAAGKTPAADRPGKTPAADRPGKTPAADRPGQTPEAPLGGRGVSPVTLWVIIGVVAAIAIVAVIVFSDRGGPSKGTPAASAPPVADTSGTYAQLVQRANKLYDQGARQMQSGVPTVTGSQYFAVAAEVYQAAWRKQPGDPRVGTDMSVAMFYSGNTDGALQQIATVLAKSPAFQPALFNDGIFLWHKAQQTSDSTTRGRLVSQARTALRAAIKVNATNDIGKSAAQILRIIG